MSEIWCFIICFGSTSLTPVAQVDTYCATYQQVVVSKTELEQVMKLPKELRTRIQGNDLEYLCRCKGFKHKACEGKTNG